MRERAHVPRRALSNTWSAGRRDILITNPRGDRVRVTPRTYTPNESLRNARTFVSEDNIRIVTPQRSASADILPPEVYISGKVKRTRPRHFQKRNKTQKVLLLRRHQEIGFGFSIRGGIEHGTGIFVSNINRYSDAHSQGVQVGDQILKANNRSFSGISHEEAVTVSIHLILMFKLIQLLYSAMYVSFQGEFAL